jgi:hypothetical protein
MKHGALSILALGVLLFSGLLQAQDKDGKPCPPGGQPADAATLERNKVLADAGPIFEEVKHLLADACPITTPQLNKDIDLLRNKIVEAPKPTALGAAGTAAGKIMNGAISLGLGAAAFATRNPADQGSRLMILVNPSLAHERAALTDGEKDLVKTYLSLNDRLHTQAEKVMERIKKAADKPAAQAKIRAEFLRRECRSPEPFEALLKTVGEKSLENLAAFEKSGCADAKRFMDTAMPLGMGMTITTRLHPDGYVGWNARLEKAVRGCWTEIKAGYNLKDEDLLPTLKVLSDNCAGCN